MKAVFIHDHKAVTYQNNFYSTGGLPYKVLTRYLEHFDEINVLLRGKNSSDINLDKVTLINGPKVNVVIVNDYNKYIDQYLKKDKIEKKLRNEIEKVDAVIIRLPSVLGTIGYKIAKELNKTIIVEVVACVFDNYWNSNIFGKILAFRAKSIMKKTVKNSDHVAYITKNFLQSRYPTNGIAYSDIPNVSLKEFPEYSTIGKGFNLPIKLGMIGGFGIKHKNHKTFLKIANKLKKMGYSCNIELVGSGNKKKILKLIDKLKLAENITYFDSINNSKISEWYDSLDFYIQPSKSEGHGRSVIEAMARGLIVISSNVGGLIESVDIKDRFRCNDYVSMSKRIIFYLNNLNEALEKKVRNYNYAKNFSYENVEKRRKKFLDSATKNII